MGKPIEPKVNPPKRNDDLVGCSAMRHVDEHSSAHDRQTDI